MNVKFEEEDMLLSELYDSLVTIVMWGRETLEQEEITSALLTFNERSKPSEVNS